LSVIPEFSIRLNGFLDAFVNGVLEAVRDFFASVLIEQQLQGFFDFLEARAVYAIIGWQWNTDVDRVFFSGSNKSSMLPSSKTFSILLMFHADIFLPLVSNS